MVFPSLGIESGPRKTCEKAKESGAEPPYLEDPTKSYHAKAAGHNERHLRQPAHLGDNLIALKALEQSSPAR